MKTRFSRRESQRERDEEREREQGSGRLRDGSVGAAEAELGQRQKA
jgi:hypothetical protein